MIRHFTFGAAIAAFICGTICPATAAKLPRYGVFVYSSECWEKESGDAAGNRVLLLREGTGDTLYWYWSDGPMEGPNRVNPLSIDNKTAAIQFSVDIGSDIVQDRAGKRSVEPPAVQKFQGSISDDAITLSLVGGSELQRNFKIPRLRDFSAKPGECK